MNHPIIIKSDVSLQWRSNSITASQITGILTIYSTSMTKGFSSQRASDAEGVSMGAITRCFGL